MTYEPTGDGLEPATVTKLKTYDTAGKVKAQTRKVADKAQEVVKTTAEQLSQKISTATDKTGAAVERASVEARKVADKVDPFVHERPYAALGIGIAAGIVIGMLFAGRGPKVIYVKPRV